MARDIHPHAGRHVGAERELQHLVAHEIARRAAVAAEHRVERAMGGEPRLGRHLGQHLDEPTAQGRGHVALIALGILGLGAVHHHHAEIAQARHECAGEVAAGRLHRQPVEEPEPAFAGAAAILVIAAHQHPGGGREQRRRRGEEVGIPGVPAVAVGAAGAARMAGRAGVLPVMIVADVNDEIGAGRRRCRGDLGERPGIDVVAVLGGIAVGRRQPVSPKTRMRCGLGRGSGRALPSSTAATASGGTTASHERTGNGDALTLPKLRPGSARTLMGTGLPSKATDGQASSVIARTLELPSGPIWTHWARISGLRIWRRQTQKDAGGEGEGVTDGHLGIPPINLRVRGADLTNADQAASMHPATITEPGWHG